MKKSGKIINLSAAVALSLSIILTGCGNSGVSDSTASGTSTAASTVAADSSKELEPYEVVWYQTGNGMTPDIPLVQEEMAKLCKDINTTLKITYFQWGEYKDKMSLLMQSGESFDLSWAASSRNYAQNASKGSYVDITDTFETKMPKYSAIVDKGLLEAAKINGRIFGLPTNKEAFAVYGFDVDKEFAEQAGIDPTSIKTLDDMGNALRIIKQKMPDITPLFMKSQSSLPFEEREWDQIGDSNTPGVVYLDDTSTKVIDQYQSPEMMNNWKRVSSWYKEGLINKNPVTLKDETIFSQRKAFARPGPLGAVPEWIGSAKNVLYRATIGNRIKSTSAGQGSMVAFSSTSKNIDRAMMFFDKFATDADMINLLTFGIKDKHYVIKDDTTNPPTWDYLPGQDGNKVTYSSGGAWTMGANWFLSYLSTSDPKNRNEVIQASNQQVKNSPLLGFTFDSTSVSNEIAACNNVIEEYYRGLSTGMLDPDKYAPLYIEKLKASGSDKIIAEKQKQIDEWKVKLGK